VIMRNATANIFCLLCLYPALGMAQKFSLSAGVKGGVPFTDLLTATDVITGAPAQVLSQSDNYLVGPVVQLNLPFGFGVEADGLYRATRYTLVTNNESPVAVKSSSWEVPILIKYTLPTPLIRPFLGVGPVFRRFNDAPPHDSSSDRGLVAGGGVEIKIGALRLSGEARYLRWGTSDYGTSLRLSRNQGEVLIGILF